MEITQEEYTKRLKSLDPKTKEVVLSIESNPAILVLAETYDLDQDTTYAIANKINLQLLGFIKSNDVLEYISTSTVIDGDEFKTIYPKLLDNILKKSDQQLFEVRNDERVLPVATENKIEEAKLADPEHISHHDLLSEIENPTPSISTTVDFQNQNFVKSSQPQANTPVVKTSANKGVNTATTTTPDGTIHSSATTNTYTNPALNIATKLDQKLSTPSASIPKDIYVSKKPDPYHELVDL